jgi:hypothetical protein
LNYGKDNLPNEYDSIHPERKNFADLFGPGNVPGLLTEGDMSAIKELSRMLPDSGLLVEIGCFLGKSSVEWARNLKDQNKNYKILCVDSFNSPDEILQDLLIKADFVVPPNAKSQIEMFKHYTSDYPNIKPIKAFFNQSFVFPAKANLIFEDSTHTQEYLSYALPFWWNHLDTGGILSGHDYGQDVQVAVDLFVALNDFELNTFDNSSIWWIKKHA